MEAVVPLVSCKAEHALWFLFHFLGALNLKNMADRSIAKYLKQEVSEVMMGLNEEAGFSIMPL